MECSYRVLGFFLFDVNFICYFIEWLVVVCGFWRVVEVGCEMGWMKNTNSGNRGN